MFLQSGIELKNCGQQHFIEMWTYIKSVNIDLVQAQLCKGHLLYQAEVGDPMVLEMLLFQSGVHDERNLCITVGPVDVYQTAIADAPPVLEIGEENLCGPGLVEQPCHHRAEVAVLILLGERAVLPQVVYLLIAPAHDGMAVLHPNRDDGMGAITEALLL